MLLNATIAKLEALGLGAMAAALADQLATPGPWAELSFEDRLGLLVDREADARDSRRLATRLKAAKLRYIVNHAEDKVLFLDLTFVPLAEKMAAQWPKLRHCVVMTDRAHMPASHRAHLEWTPSRLVEWGRSVSPATAAFVERVLTSRPHPEHAYRTCLGLMSLARRYGNERTGAACERALAAGATSYSSVKSILAEGLDRVPLRPSAPPPPPEHENLRGAEYWHEEA